MRSTQIVRVSVLAAAVAAALAVTPPAEAGWGARIGFSAAIVAPPVVVAVGHGPYRSPYYRSWVYPAYRPVYGSVYGPRGFAGPLGPGRRFARVFVRFPFPHWVERPVVLAPSCRGGY
jgi:hypothetical protein